MMEVGFGAQGGEGEEEGIPRGAVGEGEAEEPRKQRAVGDLTQAEVSAEGSPGFAVLEGAVFGIFLFGIFVDGALEQLPEPGLDDEGGGVERVVGFPGAGEGAVEVGEKGQRRSGGIGGGG